MNLVSDVLKTRCVLKANLMGFQKKGKKNYSIKGSKGKFLINNKEKSILPANITLSTPANPTKVSLKCPKKNVLKSLHYHFVCFVLNIDTPLYIKSTGSFLSSSRCHDKQTTICCIRDWQNSNPHTPTIIINIPFTEFLSLLVRYVTTDFAFFQLF